MEEKTKRLLRMEVVSRVFEEARETFGKNGKEFVVNCPFPHEKGGRYKMYISENGSYYCQDCGSSGSAWRDFFDSVVSERYGHLRLVRERPDPRLVTGRKSGFATRGRSVRWAGGKILAPGRTAPLCDLGRDHPAYEYLEVHRGMDPSEFASDDHPFCALYCEEGQFEMMGGELRSEGRVVFPVIQEGDPVGWTARTIERQVSETAKEVWTGSEWRRVGRLKGGRWADRYIPKWLHLPSMQKSRILYNLDAATEAGEEVVMVEGVFDCMKAGTGSVAYFGEFPSEAQTRMAMNRFSRIFWIPDAGVDLGDRRAKNFLDMASSACEVLVAPLPGRGDPGEREVTREEIEEHKKKMKEEAK